MGQDLKKVLDIIEQARRSNATSLDLTHQGMTSLPPTIGELTALTHLNLDHNELTELPDEIAGLTCLISLDLSGNEFRQFPSQVFEFAHLQTLNLWSNRLEMVPPDIASLTKLTSLDLGQNPLPRLPPELARLPNLREFIFDRAGLTAVPEEIIGMTGLIALGLYNNELTSIPPELYGLRDLRILLLAQNKLRSLPAGISGLKNLRSLSLGRNGLVDILPEVFELPALTTLQLDGNRLRSLPKNIGRLKTLQELNLADNQLTAVPRELLQLPELTKLNFRGNPLPVPPEALANADDVRTIVAALAGIETGERLNEAKMLVVGDGNVGKSSIVQRLMHDTFDPNKHTTLGVEIIDEMKVLQSEVAGSGGSVKLNIWDFGGQEIQHSTHQFFLTTRSVYLLVVDARKGDQLNNVEYWLKLIASFGGDSPIIVVINQIDRLQGQRALNLDRTALQAKYNIRSFVETSCNTGAGLEELRATIASAISQLRHVGDIWPREWSRIKMRLKDLGVDYIPVERYLEICREEGLHDAGVQQSLLDLLHVLGTVVRFPGDTQVLNPRWVTHGVYGLLTSAQLVKDRGQFELRDVGVILGGLPDAGHYPPHTYQRLINVMRHFELCFEFTDRPGHYLIPRHLHDNELDIGWDDAGALKVEYRYATLPDSIISRFIVRMNQYIRKQYYWKNGVYLQSGDNRAKVKSDLVDRKILISVTGKERTRRAFLAVIRSTLDEINANFKIEIQQMVAIPEFPEVLVSYDRLLAHEEMNEPDIVIPELRRKFSVRGLLDGMEEAGDRNARRKRGSGEEGSPPPAVERGRDSSRRSRAPAPATARANPWASGAFYVFAWVIILSSIVAAIVVLKRFGISLEAGGIIAVVLIGALLAIGVIGANQLKNDDRLTDANYVKLMTESYKRLPLLRGGRSERARAAQ